MRYLRHVVQFVVGLIVVAAGLFVYFVVLTERHIAIVAGVVLVLAFVAALLVGAYRVGDRVLARLGWKAAP